MPPFGENIPIAATDVGPGVDAGAAIHASFCFVPRELAIQCRQLIESYHTLYGYVGPADMLGLADTRDIIEDHRDLARIFKKASNDGFLLIATTILSVELLARDFSGWGKRFPAARCKAEKVLNNSPQPRRTWLMDLYLFRPPGARCSVWRLIAH
jgi:hypothetical protein